MKIQKSSYRLVTQTESAQENGITNVCLAEDILFDIKYLLKDYYAACFDKNEESLILRLSNGQSFMICVNAILAESDTSLLYT